MTATVKRHEEKVYGIQCIFRHDYQDEEIMAKIRTYINRSVKELDDFLTNVPGSENFTSFCDIGCGEDHVVNMLDAKHDSSDDFVRQKFDESYGIDLYIEGGKDRQEELDNVNISSAVSRTGVYKHDWYDMADTFGQTDVMFINHSLEHAANPFALMEQISKMQNRGNVLFVAVPDADYDWAYSMTSSTTHFSIFNEGFLQEILQRYGYRVCVEKREFRANSGELFAFCVKQMDGLPD